MGYSISASQGRVAQYHDERQHTPENVDERLSKNNKTLVKQGCSYHEAFNKMFQGSVDAYNAKQTREDRKVKDYYESLQGSDRKEKPVYEYVFQIGNHETNGVTSGTEDEAKAREALDTAMAKLQGKYPAFKFMFIGSHADEPGGTYHYHVAFTPVGTGYKTGMQERCSLTKALNAMGFKTNKQDGLAIQQWQNEVKDDIEEEMRQRGLEREYMDNTDKHLSVSSYKRKKKAQELEKREEAVQQKQAQNEAERQSLEDERKKLDAFINRVNTMVDAYNTDVESFKAYKEGLEQEKPIYKQEYEKAVKTANTGLEEYNKAKMLYENASSDITMGYVPAMSHFNNSIKEMLSGIKYKNGETIWSRLEERIGHAYFEATEEAKRVLQERLADNQKYMEKQEKTIEKTVEPIPTEEEIQDAVEKQVYPSNEQGEVVKPEVKKARPLPSISEIMDKLEKEDDTEYGK